MKVLIVEDDRLIAELERDFLLASNFEIEIAETGMDGIGFIEKEEFDAVLLDLMLPQMDGTSVCRKIREKSNVPIIMVTAKKEDVDKIRGLAVGADDYIVKPFSPTELVARVRAHISIHERIKKEFEHEEIEEKIEIRNLEIYPKARRIFRNKEEVALTNKEFELLLFFIENPNIAFSKDTLFDRIWGMDAVGDTATVTVHVNRLREKIEPDEENPMIQTVWGIGYRFRLE
ncbi:DNA-binding response regulator [Lacrimispora amygdalina]|uniref:Stage 0 sporulation protein A homolog n=1 Tax=Lacrimispora amygdalina TaxID=253257 RepID=A0ABQ5M1T3_9FIRM|nr:response regulator transcription factor [Haloimpatiens lingqiaonensis]